MIETTALRRKLLDLAISGKLVPKTGAWRTVRLLDVCNRVHYGFTASSGVEGNAQLLRITDIQDGHVAWENVPYCMVPRRDLDRYLLRNGDIVIARTGATVGKSYLVEGLNTLSVFASYLIRVIPNETVSSRFLKIFLDSSLYWRQISEKAVGTGQPNVNAEKLKSLEFPLPPLAEQKAIVKRLEELLALEREIAADSAALDDLITAAKRKILGLAISGKLVPKQGEWKTVPVGAVAEVELGKRVCKKTDAGIPYKFLGNINVRWGSFDLTTLKETFFNEKEAEQFSLKNGDLLICEGGVPGRCAIWEADETDIKYQMALHRVRPHHELLAAFLRYYLEAVHRRQLFTKHFIGCTIAHLTKEILLKLPIPLPPLAEQKAIVKRVEELFAVLDAMKGAK